MDIENQISDRISEEINDNWTLSNAHGVDLKKCLITPPKKGSFVDSFSKAPVDLWLVLEEAPEDKSGYKIVFDETSNMFGLATAGWEGSDIYLGPYGTFLEALESM